MKLPLLSTALALACAAAPMYTQTIAGRVVDYATRKSVGRISIELVDDSARVVASAEGDTTGIFYVDAPGPGRYRVVIVLASGSFFLSPEILAAAGDFIEREFLVPALPPALCDAYFPAEVDIPAVPHAGNAAPSYPEAMAQRQIRGSVIAMFVVGEDGRPEMRTLQMLSTSDSAFMRTVGDALREWRYDPAEREGARVRQVVQITFQFGVAGDAPGEHAVIRAASTGATPGDGARDGALCDVAVQGAELRGWRAVATSRFTFCVPPDWSGDGESWRAANGASVSLSLGIADPGMASERMHASVPAHDARLMAGRSSAGTQPRSESIGGRSVSLYSSRSEGRYSWTAVWMASAISLLGTAFDRATSDLELTIFRTVRFAVR